MTATAAPAVADDRRPLRRAVGLAAVAVAAFALACGGWNLAIDRLHARPAVPQPFAAKLDAALADPAVDTVFIGSSRFFHGLDPRTFDAETGRLGLHTHSYNLGFDALGFPEERFLVQHVVADPRSHLKYMVVEASLRVRLDAALRNSQRAVLLHDAAGSRYVAEFILRGNHDGRRKLGWLWEQAGVTATRLSNVGALANRYVRPQEDAPVLSSLVGPAGDGFDGIPTTTETTGPPTTADDVAAVVADQAAADRVGRSRSFNAYEIEQVRALQRLVAGHGVTLVLLAPPTVTTDIYGEFAAAARADLGVPLLNFADPAKYPALYDPAGFYDPDHVNAPAAEKLTVDAADGFVRAIRTGVAGSAAIGRPQ